MRPPPVVPTVPADGALFSQETVKAWRLSVENVLFMFGRDEM